MQNNKLHESELTKFQLQIGRVSVAQMFDKTEREGKYANGRNWRMIASPPPPPYTLYNKLGVKVSVTTSLFNPLFYHAMPLKHIRRQKIPKTYDHALNMI